MLWEMVAAYGPAAIPPPFRQDQLEEFHLRKQITAFALALISVLLLLCSSVQTASAAQPQEDYIAAVHTKSNGNPYYIMVNRAQSTVTVYGLDDDGYYTIPVKAMICSTGRKGHATYLGTFSIGGRWPWLHMIDNSYGQYATQITGNILFHSVCYTKKDPSTLMTEEYNGLGAPASLGCVRLQTADAKWIYDNCASGTKVTIYDGADPGPLGKPDKLVEYISEEQANGWDPTDPREENPWHELLTAGQDPDPEPGADSTAPPQDEDTLSYTQMAQALYELSSGKTGLTRPDDPISWAWEHHLLDDIAGDGFDPSAPIPRQDLITMLYRHETLRYQRSVRNLGSIARFTDWPDIRQYARTPVRWALGNRLLKGYLSDTFDPDGSVTPDQLDAILQQYALLHPSQQ